MTAMRKHNPDAIIFSGGPSSSFNKLSPKVKKEIYELNKPILGICYGMQLICSQLGGKVKETKLKEFGKAKLKVIKKDKLFPSTIKVKESSQVWMSHGDEVIKIPPGFRTIATTNGKNIAAISNVKRKIYGLQFHPEVVHTIQGKKFLVTSFLIYQK